MSIIFKRILGVITALIALFSVIFAVTFIGQDAGTAFVFVVLFVLMLICTARLFYSAAPKNQINYITIANREGRVKLRIIIHYMNGKTRTKLVNSNSLEFKHYAKYIR